MKCSLESVIFLKRSLLLLLSLQSCPTLCDPIDSSPPGSPIPGILQARTLEWVAISFSNAWKWTFPFYCFPLFLCIDHWGRLSYLSLVFSGTLHSNGYIFPFLLCFLLLFFSQLFVRPPQTAILLFCIPFKFWGWSWSLSPVQYHEPPSIVLQTLCLSDIIPWIYFSLPLYKHKGLDSGHTWIG